MCRNRDPSRGGGEGRRVLVQLNELKCTQREEGLENGRKKEVQFWASCIVAEGFFSWRCTLFIGRVTQICEGKR